MALAVSGHGFGHAVRSAEVARALLRAWGARDAPHRCAARGCSRREWSAAGAGLAAGCRRGAARRARPGHRRRRARRWESFAADFEAHAAIEARAARARTARRPAGRRPTARLCRRGSRRHSRARRWPTSAGTGSTPPGPTSSTPSPRPGRLCQGRRLFRLPLHSPTPDAFPAFADDRRRAVDRAIAQRSRARGAPRDRPARRRAGGAGVVWRLRRQRPRPCRARRSGRSTCSC